MIKFSIIIVHYNTFKDLKDCLISIFNNEIGDCFEVIVVDNNSKDRLIYLETIGDFHGRVKYILNDSNMGFARACNQGYECSRGKSILFLNPDIIWAGSILDYIDFNYRLVFKSNLGILGVNLVDECGFAQFTYSKFASISSYILRSFGIKTFFEKCGVRFGDLKYSNESMYVDQIIGAFFYLSKETFETVGYFDERFFVYFEEMDFCYRAYQQGIHCYYFNDVTLIHKGAVTSKSFKRLSLFFNLNSRLLYFKKHFSIVTYVVIWFTTVFVEVFIRLLVSLFSLKLPDVKDLLYVFRRLLFESKL